MSAAALLSAQPFKNHGEQHVGRNGGGQIERVSPLLIMQIYKKEVNHDDPPLSLLIILIISHGCFQILNDDF